MPIHSFARSHSHNQRKTAHNEKHDITVCQNEGKTFPWGHFGAWENPSRYAQHTHQFKAHVFGSRQKAGTCRNSHSKIISPAQHPYSTALHYDSWFVNSGLDFTITSQSCYYRVVVVLSGACVLNTKNRQAYNFKFRAVASTDKLVLCLRLSASVDCLWESWFNKSSSLSVSHLLFRFAY